MVGRSRCWEKMLWRGNGFGKPLLYPPHTPGPEVEVSQEQVPHNPLQLAEPVGEWLGSIGERLDEPRLGKDDKYSIEC